MVEPSLRTELELTVRADMLNRLQLPDQIMKSNSSATPQVYYRLQQLGYTGSNANVESHYGFFCPHTPVHGKNGLGIFVATMITWVFGAPGIARFSSEETEVFIPGVFVDTDIPFAVLLDRSACRETNQTPRSSTCGTK